MARDWTEGHDNDKEAGASEMFRSGEICLISDGYKESKKEKIGYFSVFQLKTLCKWTNLV